MVLLEIEIGAARVEMGMNVNQAGGDVIRFCRNHGAGMGSGNAGGDARNSATRHRDIQALVAPVLRIDYMPVLDQQVVDAGLPEGPRQQRKRG